MIATTWAEQEKARIEKFELWHLESQKLIGEIVSCVSSENRRAGAVEAYNLTQELNQKIEALYLKHFESITEFNGRKSWVGVKGLDSEWHLEYYGKNANKFYIMRWTKEQNKAILTALADAAEENEKY